MICLFKMRIFEILEILKGTIHYYCIFHTVQYILEEKKVMPLSDWSFLPFDHHLPVSFTSQPQIITILVASLSLILLDSLYKWEHVVFVFLCLISLSIMFSSSIYVVKMTKFLSFKRLYNIPWFIFSSHFLYACIHWWTVRLIPYLGFCE